MYDCNSKLKSEFDYSSLSVEFNFLSKPAQRALIKQNILTPEALCNYSVGQLLYFHGIGKTTIPKLLAILEKNGISFSKI